MVGGLVLKTKVLGCNLVISPIFMGMITIILMIDGTGLMVDTLGAMLVHELGHLLVLWWVGCFPKEIRLLPFEINVIAPKTTVGIGQEIFISAAGVMANLLVFGCVPSSFGQINLYLAIFHALPLYSLDGYQVFALIFGEKSLILAALSRGTAAVLLFLGVGLLVYGHNPMLLLFLLYLSVVGFGEKRKLKNNGK